MRFSPTHLARLACLTLCASPAANAEFDESPSYSWVGGGVFWANSGDEAVNDLSGFALAASVEPVRRLVLSLSYEAAEAEFDAQGAAGDFELSALVAAVGSYIPLSTRLHLNASVGLDVETAEISFEGETESDDFMFASLTAGLIYKASRRVELAASMQRLEGISDGVEGEGNWVARADLALSVTDAIDLLTSLSYEDDEPAAIVGARVRF